MLLIGIRTRSIISLVIYGGRRLIAVEAKNRIIPIEKDFQ
jgi:hypothetical protein